MEVCVEEEQYQGNVRFLLPQCMHAVCTITVGVTVSNTIGGLKDQGILGYIHMGSQV